MSNIKLKILIIFIIIFVLSLNIVYADQYYDIQDFNIDIRVSEDNIYYIEETITVQFKTARHGIFRKIPEKYYGYKHKISNIFVTDGQGNDYDYKVSKSGGYVEIKIGDPDIWVDGIQVYKIRYMFNMGDDLDKTQDEVYWNLIGTEWDCNIYSANFKIELPKNFDANKVNFTSGDFGNTDNYNVFWDVTGNIIEGQILQPLQRFEALTIALPLPEGYFSNVSSKPINYVVVIIFGFMLFLFLASIKLKKDSDKSKSESIKTIMFKPPNNLNPAEVGYIYDRIIDDEDITSLIIYWANKGLLEIQEVEDRVILGIKLNKYYLKKLKDIDTENTYERNLFNEMFFFANNNILDLSDLKNVFYKRVSKAKLELKKTMDEKYAVYNTSYDKVANRIGKFSFFAFLFLIINLMCSNFGVEVPVIFIAFCITSFVGAMLHAIFSKKDERRRKHMKSKANKKKNIIRYIILTIIILQTTFVLIPILSSFNEFRPELEIVMDYFNIGLNIGFEFYLILGITLLYGLIIRNKSNGFKLTEQGEIILGKVDGFKEFIEVAEKDKLEMLVDENPNYFFDILPYAIVLNVTDKWSDKFNDLVSEPPKWYNSNSFSTFNATSFTNSMSNTISSISNTMTSSPRSSSSSSSSSSGGSSGGGGGGGGGGSW